MSRSRSSLFERPTFLCLTLFFSLIILMFFELQHVGQTYRAKGVWDEALEDTREEPIQPHTFEETILHDGTWRYEYRRPDSDPELLVLALNHDESSWDRSYPDYKQRHAKDFFDLIGRQANLANTSMGIMTASKSVYARLKRQAVQRGIGRITILYHSDTQTYSYNDRHQDAIQYERRATIASLRNTLMSRTLQDEEFIFWLDADVVDMSNGLIDTMIAQARKNPKEVGAITARCQQASSPNYDLNAWYVDRSIEGITLAVTETERQSYSDKLTQTRRYIPDQIRGLRDDQMGKLDAVGGTSLLLRAELVRKGVTFPPFKIIGTTWALDGWAAQETEGICYMAEKIHGSGCWVLGGSHFTRHAG